MICASPKPSQTWPMLLAIVLAIVRLHVDDDETAAGLEDAARLRPGRAPDRARGAAPAPAARRRPRRRRRAALRACPAADSTWSTGRARSAAASIAAEASTPMTRRTNGATSAETCAGAAAEIGDDPVGIEQAEQRLGRHGRAEQLVAQPAPLAGRAGEEGLRGGATGVEDAGQAPGVRRGGGRRSRPGRGRPATAPWPNPAATARVHGVEPARRLAARGHPAAVRQRLQVPADGRLRQPQDLAQLRDGELVRLEHGQDAHAGGVREDGELVEDGSSHSGSGIRAGETHPSSRMEEYTAASLPVDPESRAAPADQP